MAVKVASVDEGKTMSEFKIIAFLNPVEGRDAEFNEWYDKEHMPHALSVGGFSSGQRFRTGPTLVGDAPCKYAAIYDVEGDSLQDALDATGYAGSLRLPTSDAVDQSSAVAWALTPIGPLVYADGQPQPDTPGLLQLKIIAFLNAAEGRDADFNEYYETVHMANSLTIDEFRSGRRFKASPLVGPDAPGVYATIYDVEADSVETAINVTGHHDDTPKFPPPHGTSDAADYSNGQGWPLTPLGPVLHSSEGARSDAAAAKV
jgi:hypothetical protein